jgi:chemotaxis protein methyltransferase CheR
MWCGAASSGQEPYTVLMVLAEKFPELAGWTIDFLATDISSEMVAKCNAGRYSQLEMNRGMPTPLLLKYFERDGLDWKVRDELRKRVTFRTIPTKLSILAGIRRVLRPGGWLFLGSAESTLGLDDGFERVTEGKAVVYRNRKD